MNTETAWRYEYQRMIDDCLHRAQKLSEWETGFLQSVSEQIDAGRVLSAKQMDKLNDIWERVTNESPTFRR